MDAEFDALNEYYRHALEGHVYVRETIDAVLEAVANRVRALAHPPRFLELGSHAGFITERLLERWPRARITVQDDDERVVAAARRRLGGRPVEFLSGHAGQSDGPFDVVLSIARHHHLPHDYLAVLRGAMTPGSVYVVGDELCPEYCTPEHARRIADAETLHIAGGYVLTSVAEVRAFEETGAVPSEARELEDLRRNALWRWYRFVADEAVRRGYFDIAAGELKSAADDFVTGSDAEHKFGPLVVERQFALAGYRRLSKRSIGPAEHPERQSMFVYEYALA